MRQRWLGLGLTIGLLACSYGYGVAGLTEQYIAEGVAAMVQYDQAAARLRALQGAFREALEQAVADMADTSALVNSNWQALRARIYAKPLQYIVSYRVLWEYPDLPQKVYRVGVEAEIPVSELSHALDAIGLTRRREDARIVLFMAERFPGQTSQTFAASRGVALMCSARNSWTKACVSSPWTLAACGTGRQPLPWQWESSSMPNLSSPAGLR